MDWRELETFSFGDSPALADELAALVLAGMKTATAAYSVMAKAVMEQGLADRYNQMGTDSS
jgi:uncharacterized protein YhfF